MSNVTQAVQREMLNDAVKESKDVKVIVLKNGTVQVVGINETNVDDGLPNTDPIAEIIPESVPFNEVGVEAKEVVQPVEVKTVKPTVEKPKAAKTEKVSKEKDTETKVTKE